MGDGLAIIGHARNRSQSESAPGPVLTSEPALTHSHTPSSAPIAPTEGDDRHRSRLALSTTRDRMRHALVEVELWMLRASLRELHERRQNVIWSGYAAALDLDIRASTATRTRSGAASHAHAHADPTARKAMALVDLMHEYALLARRTQVLCDLLLELPPDLRKAVHVRYLRRGARDMTWDEVAAEIGCHRTTAMRRCDEVVARVRSAWVRNDCADV